MVGKPSLYTIRMRRNIFLPNLEVALERQNALKQILIHDVNLKSNRFWLHYLNLTVQHYWSSRFRVE
jgi:hypothetical protein